MLLCATRTRRQGYRLHGWILFSEDVQQNDNEVASLRMQ